MILFTLHYNYLFYLLCYFPYTLNSTIFTYLETFSFIVALLELRAFISAFFVLIFYITYLPIYLVFLLYH